MMTCCLLRVRGIVQGVGFRPFAYRLATSLSLDGWIRNDGDGVGILLAGPAERIAVFTRRLAEEHPPLARIDTIETAPAEPEATPGFRILESGGITGHAAIGPDTCTCPACLAELFDPDNRRYRYAFTNCTDCGPRYTLTARLPYDRGHTSMADFAQCPSCLAEYTDPGHRRFHAEPNACPDCGPRLQLAGAEGQALPADPVAATLALLRTGHIVAIKGLGGFHLACDARNAEAVARLRQRKARPDKPFAIMAANPASLDAVAGIDTACLALLEDRARPVVLLPKSPCCDSALAGVAPDMPWLGAMLPYTPLHYLLFHEAAARPDGTAWLAEPQALLLVMTSANPHGEPLVTTDDAARALVPALADAVLLHDRRILVRVDDSVVRPGRDGTTSHLRRARGHAPLAIPLSAGGPSVLALGAHLKNAPCMTRDDEAFPAQHIGDLDRSANCEALEQAASHLCTLLGIRPQCIAHDAHPDLFSTRLARTLAERWQIPAIGVQHHHAHIAAVVAEHGHDGPVLGLALDGIGMGTDGEAWGGELLHVDGAAMQRLGRLYPLPLPGGDLAARTPWRMGAALLHATGNGDDIAARFAGEALAAPLARLLAEGRYPLTSSAGRWFDAIAALLDVRHHCSFEGQAAMQLEGLACRTAPLPHPVLHAIGPDPILPQLSCLDLRPAVPAILAAGREAGAALFHAVLADGLCDWIAQAADATGLRTVACAGGCLQNGLLSDALHAALAPRGITLLEARQLPPGDGGLALGQARVARLLLPTLKGHSHVPGHPRPCH